MDLFYILFLFGITLVLVNSQGIGGLKFSGWGGSGNSNLNNNSPIASINSNSVGCVNPFGKSGSCVLISQCPALYQILQQDPVDKGSLRFLQSSAVSCGGGSQKGNVDGASFTFKESTTVCCVNQSPNSNNNRNEIRPPIGSSFGTMTEVLNIRSLGLFLSASEERMLKSHPSYRLLPHRSLCGNSREQPLKTITKNRVGRAALVPESIVGGSDAPLGKYPWMALLGVVDNMGNTQFVCGGTIINRRYILTAAHCAQLPDNWKLSTVRVGEYDKSRGSDCDETECAPPSIDVPIEQFIGHEEYNKNGQIEHDIALIRLSQDIQFNRFMSPICLPLSSTGDPNGVDGSKPTVAGWGRTQTDVENNSPILQHVSVPLVAQSTCNDFYKGRLRTNDIGPGRFCAGGELNMDSCKGDSGGPLMISSKQSSSTQIYQIGIVSLGPETCGAENEPALYTKVSNHLNWILDQIKP